MKKNSEDETLINVAMESIYTERVNSPPVVIQDKYDFMPSILANRDPAVTIQLWGDQVPT